MLSFGAVSDRLGRRPAFALYSLLTAAAVGTLAAAWAALLPHPALFWTVMLALGVGSGCTAGFGALLAELYPTEVRTAAMGATYNLARTAQLATPVVVGLAVAQLRAGGRARRFRACSRWRPRRGCGCYPRRAASLCHGCLSTAHDDAVQ